MHEAEPSAPPQPEPPPARQMRITGLHHVTAICADLERTTAFYRDVLGLALVKEGHNEDDPGARHFWFGDTGGAPGTLVSFMEYPAMEEGRAGRGSIHHFALAVGSPEELAAWRDYLRGRGLECTEVLERGEMRSLYLRDPDGRLVEIAAGAR
jgi:glyoxylase I family protein